MTAVAPAIEAWAHDYLRTGAISLEPLSSIAGQFSRVQRLRIRAGDHDEVVYAKTFRPVNASADERARQLRYLTSESERLRAAAAAFAHTPSLRVPRLLASLPDHLTVITTEVQGEPLSSVLARSAVWRSRAASRRAIEALGRAGEWLRHFQAHVPIRDESAYSKDYRAYLDDRLRILVQGGGDAFTERHRAAALALFDRHATGLAPEDWWPQPAHGDFCPANILVADGAIAVIDLAMSTDRVRYLDLTHLFFHLALLARRLPLGDRRLETFQHALLEGFGNVNATSPLFRLLLLQHAISYLVQFVPAEPRRPLVRWRFRRRVGWALRFAELEI